MSCRRWLTLLALSGLLAAAPSATADDKEARLEVLYRLDLRARKPAEKEFVPDAPGFAVDVFLDRAAGRLFYIDAGGKNLAVAPAGKDAAERRDKAPRRSHRLLLPVRAWDDKAFGAATPQVGVEVYRDENSGHLVYVSHTGSFAVVPGGKVADSPGRGPEWLDRLPLKVRRASEIEPPPRRCNVEVYRDENNGCLVYVAENGSLAAAALAKPGGGRPTERPAWSHAFDTRTRAFGEAAFTARTARVAAEVYRDEPRDAWLYATDALRLAVVPAGKAPDPAKAQALHWEGLVRPRDDKGGTWSAERFLNPNTGDRLFVTAAGALAAAPY